MGDHLAALLIEAQAQGFVGPGDLQPHIAHARGFAAAVGPDAPVRVVDLGSGGGLPGLVLAGYWPATSFWLIESNQRRVQFLAEAVTRLGWEDRVRACNGRAEILGRDVEFRGTMDLVTSRGFGPPAVVAECAAPFLGVGGHLVVSEPPALDDGDNEDRWPVAGLALVGMVPRPLGGMPLPAQFAIIEQAQPCPDRYPRRVGIPAKRPLFP